MLAALIWVVYFDYIAETIIGNCSCVLFLGGKERSTLKEISETLGKETIDLYNTSDTRGSQRSMGVNYQKLGKELMSCDELAVMDGSKCILQVQGVRPFFSDKYDITKHPQYKYLSDYDPKNAFDIAKYLRTRRAARFRESIWLIWLLPVAIYPWGKVPQNNNKLIFITSYVGNFMEFFTASIDTLKVLVIALGAGFGVWGVINLLEGYGNDNSGAKSQGMKHLIPKLM